MRKLLTLLMFVFFAINLTLFAFKDDLHSGIWAVLFIIMAYRNIDGIEERERK